MFVIVTLCVRPFLTLWPTVGPFGPSQGSLIDSGVITTVMTKDVHDSVTFFGLVT